MPFLPFIPSSDHESFVRIGRQIQIQLRRVSALESQLNDELAALEEADAAVAALQPRGGGCPPPAYRPAVRPAP